jgi:hypothetical protein
MHVLFALGAAVYSCCVLTSVVRTGCVKFAWGGTAVQALRQLWHASSEENVRHDVPSTAAGHGQPLTAACPEGHSCL